MEDMQNNLPIGIDSFREIREEGRYYVDKTLMIRDFIHHYLLKAYCNTLSDIHP